MNDGRCNACRYNEHDVCAGVIQHSDGDRYACECLCLPWDEEAAERGVMQATAGDDDA